MDRPGGGSEWPVSDGVPRHIGHLCIVLVPSGICALSVQIDFRLARIGHELADWWRIGILLSKVVVD